MLTDVIVVIIFLKTRVHITLLIFLARNSPAAFLYILLFHLFFLLDICGHNPEEDRFLFALYLPVPIVS